VEHQSKAIDPQEFFKVAILFEGGLAVVALVLAWFVGIDIQSNLKIEFSTLFWAVAGTIPLFLLLILFDRYPLGSLYPIKRVLIDVLGPCLNICSARQLLILAMTAGVSEELLFRGVLQPWFENLWGITIALLLSNVLFGLAHAVTLTYAVIAGLIGLYLSMFLDIDEQRNLLIPILIHGIYDFLAFLVVAQAFRKEQTIEPI